jgi:hypothetical protein
MPSNINFGKFVLSVAVCSLVGCAETKIRPEPIEIVRLQPDCRIVEQQLDWLRSMKPTANERQNAAMQVGLFDKLSKEYSSNRNVADYNYDYVIRLKIRDIYSVCATRQQ